MCVCVCVCMCIPSSSFSPANSTEFPDSLTIRPYMGNQLDSLQKKNINICAKKSDREAVIFVSVFLHLITKRRVHTC